MGSSKTMSGMDPQDHWQSRRLSTNAPPMPASHRTESATEVFAGLVERLTFHNADTGFCVLRVKARGKRDLITVVGHAALISAGVFIQASGERSNAARTASSSALASLR
jgi:exodeoxyribonuclease V alpha subunit